MTLSIFAGTLVVAFVLTGAIHGSIWIADRIDAWLARETDTQP